LKKLEGELVEHGGKLREEEGSAKDRNSSALVGDNGDALVPQDAEQGTGGATGQQGEAKTRSPVDQEPDSQMELLSDEQQDIVMGDVKSGDEGNAEEPMHQVQPHDNIQPTTTEKTLETTLVAIPMS